MTIIQHAGYPTCQRQCTMCANISTENNPKDLLRCIESNEKIVADILNQTRTLKEHWREMSKTCPHEYKVKKRLTYWDECECRLCGKLIQA